MRFSTWLRAVLMAAEVFLEPNQASILRRIEVFWSRRGFDLAYEWNDFILHQQERIRWWWPLWWWQTRKKEGVVVVKRSVVVR
jgi:hypothetical protein